MRNTGQEGPTWRRSPAVLAPVERGSRTGGDFQTEFVPFPEKERVEGWGPQTMSTGCLPAPAEPHQPAVSGFLGCSVHWEGWGHLAQAWAGNHDTPAFPGDYFVFANAHTA